MNSEGKQSLAKISLIDVSHKPRSWSKHIILRQAPYRKSKKVSSKLEVHLFGWLTVILSFFLSVGLSVCLLVGLSVCLSVFHSVALFVCLHVIIGQCESEAWAMTRIWSDFKFERYLMYSLNFSFREALEMLTNQIGLRAQRLDAAGEIHKFNRDIDDAMSRIQVGIIETLCFSCLNECNVSLVAICAVI